MSRRRGAAAMLAALIAASTVLLSVPSGAAETAADGWVTAWAQSQERLADRTLNNQSVRMIAHVSQGGEAVRFRVQNEFGAEPLRIDRATVGLSTGGREVTEAKNATFGGRAGVTIAPGDDVWSDPVPVAPKPDSDIAVSLFVSGRVVPGQHSSAFRENYLSPAGSGDVTGDSSGRAFTEKTTSTYLVSAVDVLNPNVRGTIVPYGSSVVDGTGSTNCGPDCEELGTNRRWSDELARRIVREAPGDRQFAVANAGVAGTSSSAACPSIPDGARDLDALARLERDILELHGVSSVIYYYGTNDLAYGCTDDQILDSYREAFRRLREAGIKVYVTPITPRASYTEEQNKFRYTVGDFVRRDGNCSATCDAVLDFDKVLADPADPNRLNPEYDADGIHANIVGQKAIADSISIPLVTTP